MESTQTQNRQTTGTELVQPLMYFTGTEENPHVYNYNFDSHLPLLILCAVRKLSKTVPLSISIRWKYATPYIMMLLAQAYIKH